ncbi:MAG: hypothetical protein LBI05_07945, partial [Planctomycetaceae bacterium]|nr:hypothetical protein [Planctomycetaceae bacterium]
MIDFTALKTPEEKLIAFFLSVSPPMRQKTIIKTLDLNAFRCRETLKRLLDRKVIKTVVQFDVTLYTALNESSTALNESSTALNESSTALNESSTALNESSTALNESSTALNESSRTPESSPKPGQINLNSNKVKKERKGRNFVKEDSQAKTTPHQHTVSWRGEAGSAVVLRDATAPAAPFLETAESSKPQIGFTSAVVSSAAVCGLPSAVSTLEATEPIPYADFVAQVQKAQEVRQTPRAQSSAPSAVPATDWAKRLLHKKQAEKENGEFIPGSVFVEGDPLTAPLYRMIALLDAPDPNAPLLRETDSTASEIYLNFLDYINKTHELFQRSVRGKQHSVYDDVIHRIAFVFTLGIPQTYGYADLESLFREGK